MKITVSVLPVWTFVMLYILLGFTRTGAVFKHLGVLKTSSLAADAGVKWRDSQYYAAYLSSG